jgi:hypothetical protein
MFQGVKILQLLFPGTVFFRNVLAIAQPDFLRNIETGCQATLLPFYSLNRDLLFSKDWKHKFIAFEENVK